MLAPVGEMNKVPIAQRLKRANNPHGAERGRHEGWGVSTGRTIRATRDAHQPRALVRGVAVEITAESVFGVRG
jgi:hypothetical protein